MSCSFEFYDALELLMAQRTLTVLPVYNEASHVAAVLDETQRYSQAVLVVDDGSTDRTQEILLARREIFVLRHPQNLGYGAALRSGFEFALQRKYDVLVTIDCDGQHEPQRIPQFIAACQGEVDVVSGSRYLARFPGDTPAPPDRRRINEMLTAEINRRLGLSITDAFCGFKAYRVEALRDVRLTDNGYAMPLEFWVQAAARGLHVVEVPVPLIYLDEKRSFGGSLDDAQTRLNVYRGVLDRAMAAAGLAPATSAKTPPLAPGLGIALPSGSAPTSVEKT